MSTVGAVLIGWAGFLALLLGWLWRRGGRKPAEGDPLAEAVAHERRRPRDRRQLNLGPPAGMPERRSGFDRRMRVTAATR